MTSTKVVLGDRLYFSRRRSHHSVFANLEAELGKIISTKLDELTLTVNLPLLKILLLCIQYNLTKVLKESCKPNV
ncbi:hypothetical protein [Nostoc sp. MG11]|uniref:hypothetical protein n=1 Tax=Nostoc sp. MG11 TaxID=2721166 RepID=UPI0018666A48|nr:hypothetical protein [Nostoc sp. MG11]